MIAKFLILVSGLLLLASCGKGVHSKTKEELEKDIAPFTLDYEVAGENHGQRVYLIHGLGGHGHSFESSDTLRALKYGLVNNGYQVVTFTLPQPSREMFEDGGLEYRETYGRFVKLIDIYVGSKHGRAGKIIYGGVSFGGLHAFMAVALSKKVAGYFAIVPVTDPSALTEFAGLNTDHFNPLLELDKISSRPGFIIYGDSDARVNSGLTVRLIHGLSINNANLRFEEVRNHGHETTAEIVDRVLSQI